MGFQVNGVDVTEVNIDGQSVDEVQLDGFKVWPSWPPTGAITRLDAMTMIVNDNNVTTYNAPYTIPAGSNRVVILMTARGRLSYTSSSIGGVQFEREADHFYFIREANLPGTGSFTLDAIFDADSTGWCIFTLNGVDQNNPINNNAQSVNLGGSGTTQLVQSNPSASGNEYVAAISYCYNSPADDTILSFKHIQSNHDGLKFQSTSVGDTTRLFGFMDVSSDSTGQNTAGAKNLIVPSGIGQLEITYSGVVSNRELGYITVVPV